MRLSEADLRRAGYTVFGRDQYFVNSCGHGLEFSTMPDTEGLCRLVPVLGQAKDRWTEPDDSPEELPPRNADCSVRTDVV